MRRPFVLLLAALFALPLSAASVDGMDIHSSSAGAGPTIVFVHGWTCDGSSWAAQVPAFAKDHRVITLDLPGHGRSESPHGRQALDGCVRSRRRGGARRGQCGAHRSRRSQHGRARDSPVRAPVSRSASRGSSRSMDRSMCGCSAASCRQAFRRR